MKTLSNYILEKLIINKNYDKNNQHFFHPSTLDELIEIIEERYESEGEGTKTKPIDFNDVDVSKLDDLHEAFFRMKFKFLDLSEWNVENVKNVQFMFYDTPLEYVKMTNWNFKNDVKTSQMFDKCKKLKICDLSNMQETEHNIDFIQTMSWMYYSGIFKLPKWYDDYR